MIKLAGACLVFVSSCAIGGVLASAIKEQEHWLKDIKLALFLLSGEMEYHRTPFPDAVELVAVRHKGRMSPFFRELGSELRKKEGITVSELWKKISLLCFKESPLNKEQRAEFSGMGGYFTEADENVRKNATEFYLLRLEEEIIHLRENGAEKAHLYRTLGVLSGIFLIILAL